MTGTSRLLAIPAIERLSRACDNEKSNDLLQDLLTNQTTVADIQLMNQRTLKPALPAHLHNALQRIKTEEDAVATRNALRLHSALTAFRSEASNTTDTSLKLILEDSNAMWTTEIRAWNASVTTTEPKEESEASQRKRTRRAR